MSGYSLTDFPELNAFGTILRFAAALESTLADLATRAGEDPDLTVAGVEACARRHKKRMRQVEQWRRERLNEVVLQPLSGLDRNQYLPAGLDDASPMEAILAWEEAASRFYNDVADSASEVLGGLGRSFRKMAGESSAMAAVLKQG